MMFTLISGIVTALREDINIIDAVQREFIDNLAGKVERIEHKLGLKGSCTDYISSVLFDHASTWASHPIVNNEWCGNVDRDHISACVSYVILRSYSFITGM